MIKSFRHKGIEDFFLNDVLKGIIPDHALKLARILDRLDASLSVKDMNLPGFKLHKLTGKGKNIWAVRVSGNWRVTFYFEQGNAYVVDYLNYH